MNAQERRIYHGGPTYVLRRDSTIYEGGWHDLNVQQMQQYLEFASNRDTIRAVRGIHVNALFNGEVIIQRTAKQEDEDVIAGRSRLYKPFMQDVLRVLDALGFDPVRFIPNKDPSTMEHDPLEPVQLNISLLTSACWRTNIDNKIEWEFYQTGRRDDGLGSVPIPGVYVIVREPPRIYAHGSMIVSRVASVFGLFEFADHKVRCEIEADQRRAFDRPIAMQADTNNSHAHHPDMPMANGEFPASAAASAKGVCSEATAYRLALNNGDQAAVQARDAGRRDSDDPRKNTPKRPDTRDLPPGMLLAPNYHAPDAPTDTFVAMENALGMSCQVWGIPRNAISTGNATGKATLSEGGTGQSDMMSQVFMDAQAATRSFLQTEMEKLIFVMCFDYMLGEEEKIYVAALEHEKAEAAKLKKAQAALKEQQAGQKRKTPHPVSTPAALKPAVKKKSVKQVEKDIRVTVTMPIKQPTELILTLFDKGWLEPEAARSLLSGAVGVPIACFVKQAPKNEVEFREEEAALGAKTQADAHKVAMMKPATPASKKSK